MKSKKPKKFLLMYADTSLVQSRYAQTNFFYKKVAERYAAKMNKRNGASQADFDPNLKIVVIEQADYIARGYDKQMRTVRCFMTGKEFQENINTPYTASARSETYWST